MPPQLRADAQRNREALLRVAREALVGGEVDVRMEQIAQRSGVAVGTVYRHFDTREALVEEVFRQDLDDLCSSAADGDLHAFFLKLIAFTTRSKGVAAALEAVMVSVSPVFDESRGMLEQTLEQLLVAGARGGSIRGDVTGRTVLRALSSICSPVADEAESHRIVELIFDGLQFGVGTRVN